MNKIRKTVRLLLPVAVYIIVGTIPSLLYSSGLHKAAVFALSFILCMGGSFLCGFLAFGQEGKTGVIAAVVIAELSIPFWILAMFTESSVLAYIMRYSSYFFIFLLTSSEIISSEIISAIITFSLSLALPVGFIVFGYKIRVKHSRIA